MVGGKNGGREEWWEGRMKGGKNGGGKNGERKELREEWW